MKNNLDMIQNQNLDDTYYEFAYESLLEKLNKEDLINHAKDIIKCDAHNIYLKVNDSGYIDINYLSDIMTSLDNVEDYSFNKNAEEDTKVLNVIQKNHASLHELQAKILMNKLNLSLPLPHGWDSKALNDKKAEIVLLSKTSTINIIFNYLSKVVNDVDPETFNEGKEKLKLQLIEKFKEQHLSDEKAAKFANQLIDIINSKDPSLFLRNTLVGLGSGFILTAVFGVIAGYVTTSFISSIALFATAHTIAFPIILGTLLIFGLSQIILGIKEHNKSKGIAIGNKLLSKKELEQIPGVIEKVITNFSVSQQDSKILFTMSSTQPSRKQSLNSEITDSNFKTKVQQEIEYSLKALNLNDQPKQGSKSRTGLQMTEKDKREFQEYGYPNPSSLVNRSLRAVMEELNADARKFDTVPESLIENGNFLQNKPEEDLSVIQMRMNTHEEKIPTTQSTTKLAPLIQEVDKISILQQNTASGALILDHQEQQQRFNESSNNQRDSSNDILPPTEQKEFLNNRNVNLGNQIGVSVKKIQEELIAIDPSIIAQGKTTLKESLVLAFIAQGLSETQSKEFAKALIDGNNAVIGFKRNKGIMALKISLTVGIPVLVAIGAFTVKAGFISSALIKAICMFAVAHTIVFPIILTLIVVLSLAAIAYGIMKESKLTTNKQAELENLGAVITEEIRKLNVVVDSKSVIYPAPGVNLEQPAAEKQGNYFQKVEAQDFAYMVKTKLGNRTKELNEERYQSLAEKLNKQDVENFIRDNSSLSLYTTNQNTLVFSYKQNQYFSLENSSLMNNITDEQIKNPGVVEHASLEQDEMRDKIFANITNQDLDTEVLKQEILLHKLKLQAETLNIDNAEEELIKLHDKNIDEAKKELIEFHDKIQAKERKAVLSFRKCSTLYQNLVASLTVNDVQQYLLDNNRKTVLLNLKIDARDESDEIILNQIQIHVSPSITVDILLQKIKGEDRAIEQILKKLKEEIQKQLQEKKPILIETLLTQVLADRVLRDFQNDIATLRTSLLELESHADAPDIENAKETFKKHLIPIIEAQILNFKQENEPEEDQGINAPNNHVDTSSLDANNSDDDEENKGNQQQSSLDKLIENTTNLRKLEDKDTSFAASNHNYDPTQIADHIINKIVIKSNLGKKATLGVLGVGFFVPCMAIAIQNYCSANIFGSAIGGMITKLVTGFTTLVSANPVVLPITLAVLGILAGIMIYYAATIKKEVTVDGIVIQDKPSQKNALKIMEKVIINIGTVLKNLQEIQKAEVERDTKQEQNENNLLDDNKDSMGKYTKYVMQKVNTTQLDQLIHV